MITEGSSTPNEETAGHGREAAGEEFSAHETGAAHERAEAPSTGGELLCSVLLLDGSTCLLPTTDGQVCTHRDPGAAPPALADLVDALRDQVSEARLIASTLAAALRWLRGDRGVDAVLRTEQPTWLTAGAPTWPPA